MLKEIEKYSSYFLRAYFTNLENYRKTTMKQHQVLLYSLMSSDRYSSRDKMGNTMTDAFFSKRTPSYLLPPNNPFSMTGPASLICYHDTAFFTTTPFTRDIDNLCKLSSGESILSKHTYTPSEPNPVLKPLVATWVETSKEYWVLFLPVTNALLTMFNGGDRTISEAKDNPYSILYGVVLVFPDLNGAPDTNTPYWLTIDQFKNIFNYAGLQKSVSEMEEYILAKQMRVCRIKSESSNQYKEQFKTATLTEDNIKTLFSERTSLPIQAEKVSISNTPLIKLSFTGNREFELTNSYYYNLDSRLIRMSLPAYPAYDDTICKKYGAIFRSHGTIPQTLACLRKEGKSIPPEALIYATLCFDNFIQMLSRAWKGGYSIWVDTSLVYAHSCYNAEVYVCSTRLDFGTKDKVIIYLDIETNKGSNVYASEKICEMDIDTYIATLAYVQGREGKGSSAGETFSSVGNLIETILCYPSQDYYNGFVDKATTVLTNPGTFILGDKGLTTIFNWLRVKLGTSATILSPYSNAGAFDLARTLSYAIAPDSPAVIECCKQLIQRIVTGYAAEDPKEREGIPSLVVGGSYRRWGSSNDIFEDVEHLPEFKYAPKVLLPNIDLSDESDVLFTSAVDAGCTVILKQNIEAYETTGITYTGEWCVAYLPENVGSNPTLKQFKFCKMDVKLVIPHILMPYADLFLNNQLVPSRYLNLYSTSLYNKYIKTGKAKLSREMGYLIANKKTLMLLQGCSLNVALNDLYDITKQFKLTGSSTHTTTEMEFRECSGASITSVPSLLGYGSEFIRDRDYLSKIK